MNQKNIAMLEMLSLVYEDMDIDVIEERFISLVAEFFNFDRVALLFVKHKEGMLQGKLCKGFEPGTISSLAIPIAENTILTQPLVSGFPVWDKDVGQDSLARKIGLNHFALIPIANRKRISCWQITGCVQKECPAYGNQWLRCWLVPNTQCNSGTQTSGAEKMKICLSCPVFIQQQKGESVEGIILIDKAEPLEDETISLLSIIAHAVGTAINNSKVFSNAVREAIHDDLTGLHNRRYFNERLLDEMERAKRYVNPLSLIILDIDHFKNINDTYGHPIGDRVLKWLAGIIRENVRNSDVVARYGGEEFAILLLNADKEHALTIAENLRRLIADSLPPLSDSVKLTVSLGVCSSSRDSKSFEGLVEKADKALYLAKAQGRNKAVAA